MSRIIRCTIGLLAIVAAAASPVRAVFDLTLTIPFPDSFTPDELASLQNALDKAEALWEGVITGYQPGISLTGLTVAVQAGSSFAETVPPIPVFEGGYYLATDTSIAVNRAVIANYSAWTGEGFPSPDPDYLGLDYLDDILAHEIGHALGLGTLWDDNGVYVNGTGMYTGKHGVRAYRRGFDSVATFVPVELAGSSGTFDQHWNQLMRSDFHEGNPGNPFLLSPLTGITDVYGRDLALELMTGALDPDYGQPFLSNFTIQSLRDLGYTVVPEPGALILISFGNMAMLFCRGRFNCS